MYLYVLFCVFVIVGATEHTEECLPMLLTKTPHQKTTRLI